MILYSLQFKMFAIPHLIINNHSYTDIKTIYLLPAQS